MKKILLTFAMISALTAGPAHALDISDYTAYPPFLPRVTSPNILFLLDYSKSMVRPAHGTCTEINNTTDSKYLSNCGDLSKTTYTTTPATPTVYSNLSYDYDKYTKYPGYFDNGSNKTFNNYSAGLSYKYNYETTGDDRFQKNSSGLWNGNWLNWLAMMQFDVLKKVVIGGDITPAPEGAGADSLKLRSNEGTSAGVTIRKTVNLPSSGDSTSCQSTDSPDCTQWPAVTYGWKTSAASTHVWNPTSDGPNCDGTGYCNDAVSPAITLLFPFTFYGNTYTQIYISTNGYIGFESTNMTASSNQGMPDNTSGYPNNIIAPFWDDLEIRHDSDPNKNTDVEYFTIDSGANAAPNRIFVVSFDPIYHKLDTGKADPLRFQILLYEGSNHIVFQYYEVRPTSTQDFREGRSATIGVENSDGTQAKKYSYCTSCGSAAVNNGQAVFATPHITYNITPANPTAFSKAAPLASTSYVGYIDVAEDAARTAGGYYNGDKKKYYDHETVGLFHDFRDGELGGTLGFRLGIMRIGIQGSKTDGGEVRTAGVGKYFNSKDTSSLFTAARNNEPDGKAPLAEALYEAANYFGQVATPAWSGDYVKEASACIPATTSGSTDPYCFPSASQKVACCKSFVLLLSSGNYSSDFMRNIYGTTEDEAGDADPPPDAWKAITGETSGQEWVKTSGGWLDNVAYKAHTPGDHPNDLRSDLEGTQNLALYAVNTFGSPQTSLSAAITSSATTIVVASTSSFSSSGKIQIDDEIISYTGKTATSFTGCTRGSDSTTAAAHSSGRKVYQAPVLDGAKVLKKAAKYGGFEDVDTDNAYDADKYNLVSGTCTGVSSGGTYGEDDKNCDGLPDTYFEASGGSDLKSKIIDAVTEIMKSSASGTSVSVLSTSAGGEGAIYQAYFYPAKVEGTTDERTWPGFIKSFFLDKKQNLRDDSSGGTYTCSGDSCTNDASPDAALLATEDKIAQMCLNTTTNEVKVKLYADAGGDYIADTTNDGSCPGVGVAADSSIVVGMDDVVSIWEAGKKLALRTKSTRKIYTWVPTTVTATNTGGFTSASGTPMDFTDTNKTLLTPYLRAAAGDVDSTGPYLPFTADQEAGYIIRFTRGEVITPDTTSSDNTGVSYRNRCVSISGASQETGCSGSTQRVWALGDIINSTPTLVSGPGEQYDKLYKDSDYLKFRTKYQNRRRMVYVGANDGMLHAFNAGLFNESTTSFSDNPSVNGWGSSTKLGDELWAFVPYDNLPHLQWLACNGTATDPSQCGSSEYTHVYYVDARPKVTDVRIFNDSGTSVSGLIDGQSGASHPGGWGTIMIMSMRFGGGAIDVTIGGTNREFRSAYYAFDVTDPEKPPKLLWRFYDSTLGFTTSYPAIARICSGATGTGSTCPGGTVKWYMVVGSGPTNTAPPTGKRNYGGNDTAGPGKVFVVDLEDGSPDKTFTLESSNAYMGDAIVVDKDFDFTSDVIYIGSSSQVPVSQTSPAPPSPPEIGGKVYRINTNDTFPSTTGTNWTSSTLFNATKPVLTAPSVAMDNESKLWVFFGTGRLRNSGDPSDLTNSEPQAFYGIKDGCWKNVTDNTAGNCTTPTPVSPDPADPTSTSGSPDYYYETTDLLDASNIKVTVATGGAQVEEGSGTGGTGTTVGCEGSTSQTDTSCDYSRLVDTVKAKKGWYVKLSDPATASERVLSRAAILGGVVLFTTYTPAASICSIFGDSRLYALNYQTGTAYSKAIVGSTSSSTGIGTSASTTGTYVSKGIELGKGMPTAVGIAVGEKVTGFVQKSTGEIIRIEAEPGTSVKSGAASWREKTGGGTSEIETIYKHIVK